jgi:hypothetical protein
MRFYLVLLVATVAWLAVLTGEILEMQRGQINTVTLCDDASLSVLAIQ